MISYDTAIEYLRCGVMASPDLIFRRRIMVREFFGGTVPLGISIRQLRVPEMNGS
jgi:hypothetical protein